uniref:DNA-directed RNA polymerase subunit beta n=1 Tax=Actinocyclus subtilis TaxID=1630683 RepID=A0A2U9NQ37_9STRA|nr:RNA polymerase beta subunit [Actinocyclus subtilis]AWT39234.1 RNA polymerase beta subunit [Actinocyclus subtilis]
MKKYFNYITTLPDFIEMQRVSFCWFLSYGLTDELLNFSSVFDFSGNIEYVFFGQEYKLVKPIYNILSAKRYTKNYVTQLLMPIEIRNKKNNSIMRKGQLTIANLPLMTTYATFIINGCERIIVSQIIRSPGIYFEKNKKQKKRKINKLILSNDYHKLRSFTQTSIGLLKNPDLTFLFPIQEESKYFQKFSKKNNSYNEPQFLQIFKIYRIILKTLNVQSQKQKILNFCNWLNLKNYSFIKKDNFKVLKIINFINYFNLLLKFLKKYQTLYLLFENSKFLKQESKSLKNIFPLYYKKINTFDFKSNSDKILEIFQPELYNKYFNIFTKRIKNYEFLINIHKLKLQTILEKYEILIFQENINQISNFSKLKFLKIEINQTSQTFSFLNQFVSESRNLKSVIFFPLIKNYKKSDIIKNKEYFAKKDLYKTKYEEKDLYIATIIPEYGSWIRFLFHREKKIDILKYPITNRFEDDIFIQIDKLTKKPIIHLLREMGLSEIQIVRSLQHSDFFYFNSPLLTTSIDSKYPLLRFNIADFYKNISEFSRIFDFRYYRLGKIGRNKINKRLNLQISSDLQTITYEDIFGILDYLITLSISKVGSDDIDHLKNRRVRSVGELIQQLFRVGFQRLSRKILNQVYKLDSPLILSSTIVSATIKEFFGSSQLSQYMDQTNPLSALTHKRRISGLGPGGFDRDRISFTVRDIHPSHYGRICPIETPEGQNVGLIASLTTCARVNQSGFIETPFWRVLNGKVIKTGTPLYLTADIEDSYKIAPADILTNNQNYLLKNSISVRYKQDFINVTPSEVDFIAISPIQVVSAAASLIPFFEHDDANRALMGSNMQRQSVPLLIPQKPIVGTGLENQIAVDSGMALTAKNSGIIEYVTAKKIQIMEDNGQKAEYQLQKYQRSNQETCINQRPTIWKGEYIKSGQIIADGPGIHDGELALGQNVLVAYMPWQGYNFEDAILINERLIYDDVFTSIHIERYEIEIGITNEGREETTKSIPNLNPIELQNLNEDGIIEVGTFVKPGDILVGKITPKDDSEQLPEAKLLRAIFGAKAKGVRDSSFRMPIGEYGRVIRTIIFRRKHKLVYEFEKIQIFIAQIRKIQVGDKIAGRHGNKGIISKILPRQDMPFLPDGTPIDIILNPLGVPSRMNVGQLYECLLGLAGYKLNRRFKILPFDEMHEQEMSRILINKKLRQASVVKNEAWLFNPYCPGKLVLVDGRTGKQFENPITVGNAYMLKLIHLVDDKMHSRATGPYSLVTQQPLGGKAQHGGQRFGEMEVWALEGFGAAYSLKELLTIKSDDMQGRNDTLNAIVKGHEIPTSGIPESFKVLLQELRSIGLDISTYQLEKFSTNQTGEIEVNLMEKYNPFTKTFPPTSNFNKILF